MRCPDCNKFVGFDELNVDDVEVDIDETTGQVSVSGRMVLPCADCGTELKEAGVDHEEDVAEKFGDIEAAVAAATNEKYRGLIDETWVDKNVEVTYEFDGEPEKEATERSQTTDRHGKPIKSTRYMKTFRGVCITGTVTRKLSFPEILDDGSLGPNIELEENADFTIEQEEQASAFEELT